MKRCPLCDFIYEDDQGVCDMDGFELVHERGELVPTGKDVPRMPPASAASLRWRRPLQIILLGFGLGAAVFSAYYTSVPQAAASRGGTEPAPYTARPAPPAVESTPAPVASTTADLPVEMTEPSAVETTPTPAPTTPTPEPRAAKPDAKRPRPGGGNKKKESKLTSILNKTGRMLKKPFGF